MNNRNVGQVIKGVSGEYEVKLESGEVVTCMGRGKLQRNDCIYIGDIVEVSMYNNGKCAIEKIQPRKNKLVRPYISNLDAIVLTIAIEPLPDFALVDKMLIHCLKEGIEAIICINKCDITGEDFMGRVRNDYNGLADIVQVSAKTGDGIDNLLKLIKGKYVCFSGQSAVGKSSIINSILGDESLAVGELSQKISRGKHCTRHVEIFEPCDGIKIADTCGFSVLELPMLDPLELATYFTDFDDFRDECKFKSCTHIKEPNCAVRRAVEDGRISKERYMRYTTLFANCEKQWRNRYE